MRLTDLGEHALIERIGQWVTRSGDGVLVGIGDDAAVLSPAAGQLLLVAADMLVEEVDFRRRYARPRQIGWKALAVNLSDIAAMGGTPRHALVSLGLPDSVSVEDVEELYEGLMALADRHGIQIVGGDTGAAPALMLSLTVIGEVAPACLTRRSGAQAGDLLAVTGALGLSAAGLAILNQDRGGAEQWHTLVEAHLLPTPRVIEGSTLGRLGVHAMIDLSDGLATDLSHLCRASGAGARIWLPRLPIPEDVVEAASALRLDPWRLALGGGEDFELLFALPASRVDECLDRFGAETGTRVTVIGEILEEGAGVTFLDALSQPVPVGGGFEHFSSYGSR